MKRLPMLAWVVAIIALVASAALVGSNLQGRTATATTNPVRQASVKLHRTIPKEPGGFTQGLEVRRGVLYESVGLYGSSEIRSVELKTGKVIKRKPLDQKFFAEGMTVVPGKSGAASDRIIQLTWKEQTAIVRDVASLDEVDRLPYTQEGWGVCYNATRKVLIHSDGSSVFLLRDPRTFRERGRLQVRMPDGSRPTELNELECQRDAIYVNIWQQSKILEIDPTTGIVRRTIDLSSLVPTTLASPDDVLNGIAALGNGRFLVTGKRWPNYFEVSFHDVTR